MAGRIRVEFKPTAEQVADINTKALARIPFRKFRLEVQGGDVKPARVQFVEPSAVEPSAVEPSVKPGASKPSAAAARANKTRKS